MFTHDDILTPLALTVIIDTKVKAIEITEFITQAKGLFELFELPEMSDDEISNWLMNHRVEFEAALNSNRKNTVILKSLTRFTEDAHIECLYDAILAICVSDEEYVLEESQLIKSAASIWGYARPPFKVTRS